MATMDLECIRVALRECNHRNLERVQALERRMRENGRLTRDESIILIDALEAANAASPMRNRIRPSGCWRGEFC